MNFIEISTPAILYALLQKQIAEIKGRLAVKELSEHERLQLLGEYKALMQLLNEWLNATGEVDAGFVSDKNKLNGRRHLERYD